MNMNSRNFNLALDQALSLELGVASLVLVLISIVKDDPNQKVLWS